MKNILSVLLFGLFTTSITYADSISGVLDIATGNDIPVAVADVPNVIAGATATEKVGLIFFKATEFILFVVGIAAVTMIVYSGFRYVISLGDEEQITHAKESVLYAVIGLIAVFLALMVIENIIPLFY